MIVNEYKLGDTTIQIDSTYFPKDKEEKQKTYEVFNRIGCEILKESKANQ